MHEIPSPQPIAADPGSSSIIVRHWQKIVAFCFWALLLGGWYWWLRREQLGVLDAVQQLTMVLRIGVWGPLLFVAVYALRPLVFFPSTALTIGAGFVFGPVLGVLYSLVGSNVSALVAYGVGRFFGQGLLNNAQAGTVQRYTQQLRTHSFATVLTMRLLFLPYDLVNYLAGMLSINWQAFLLATIIGSLPGTIAFVLAGAALRGTGLNGQSVHFDWRVFAASLALFALSIAISRWLKRREEAKLPAR